MSTFLKILLLVLMALLPVILSTSCAKEDDVEEIFMGKTFYISGGAIDGVALNTEVKELFLSLDSYYITFGESTFTGKLAADCTLSGRWSANGKDRKLSVIVDEYTNPSSSELSDRLAGILRNARAYEGDANILILKADDRNYIRLRTTKQ